MVVLILEVVPLKKGMKKALLSGFSTSVLQELFELPSGMTLRPGRGHCT